MEKRDFSKPLDIGQVRITDAFWGREQELVRTEVIPYQWEALNDRIPEAAPSYCMHNFRAAGRLMRDERELGEKYVAPTYTFRGFEALPEDPKHPEPDKFYGFVFQDSDFAKWIEAVGYSLAWAPDPELEKLADAAIDIVCDAQAENGYLDTYYIINGMDRIFTNLRDHHELYCFGHLVEGAVAYYQATGKDKLLRAAKRYADFIDLKFGPEEGKCKGYPGHEIAEMALARLYELTGEEKYLVLASFFLDVRGRQPYYFDQEEEERAKREGRPYKSPGMLQSLRFQYHQAHLPVREQSEAVGHAVRGVYLYSGMADVARLTEDEEMLAACERLWNSIVNEKLYLTGGIGGTHVGEAFSFPYDLPNDTAYSETCAAIGLAFFARRMLQIQADSRYGDVMEQALYNTVLAGMALDGKSFFYVNPLEVLPEACKKDERKRHVKSVRQKWFGCACCPPNIARIVSSLGAYIYTQNSHTLYTHLYVGSSVRLEWEGRKAEIVLESEFPWNGQVKAAIHVEKDPQGRAVIADRTFAFRIPGWCKSSETEVCIRRGEEKCTLAVCRIGRNDKGQIEEAAPANSVAHKQAANSHFIRRQETEGGDQDCGGQGGNVQVRIRGGYLYLTGDWQDGDEIRLTFPMEVHLVSADSRVRQNVGKVAVTRGPICYCLEEADNGSNLGLLRVDACRISKAHLSDTGFSSLDKGEEAVVKMESGGKSGSEVRILNVPGFRQEPVSFGDSLYGDYLSPVEHETILKFIPYFAWANRGEGEMSVWVRV